jgi:dTDP-4-dehydrorhamnose reductase
MILVTGASGLLGANLVCRAHDQGYETAGLCHRNVLKVPNVSMFSVNLNDERGTRQMIQRLRPEGIIHCAAATSVDWCEDHPKEAERLNGEISGVLAEVATELNAHFVYVSTDAVFDGKRGDYSELDEPAPINAYARSKLYGEWQVMQRNPQAAIARVTLYGWNAQDKLSLAEWMLKKLENAEQVPGFEDVHFTPILATDLADVLLSMLDHGLSGVYHVGGSEKISKYHFARRIAEAFDFNPERITSVELATASLRAMRPPDTSLNTHKIRAAFPCKLPDVLSGIRGFREQRENGYAHRLKSYRSGEAQ